MKLSYILLGLLLSANASAKSFAEIQEGYQAKLETKIEKLEAKVAKEEEADKKRDLKHEETLAKLRQAKAEKAYFDKNK